MVVAATLGFVYLATVFGVALLGVAVTASQLAAQGLSGDRLTGLLLFSVLLAALVRGIWVRFEAPPGVPLDPAVHPALFARVEAVRHRVGAPPVDELRLTPDINAAISLTPRGLLPPRRTLTLGLPLVSLESPDELDATIAHELGHAYGGDDRATARAARWETIWLRLAAGVGVGGWLSRTLFGHFFTWYGPWLHKRLVPLRRQRELAADAVSARAVGARFSADGLLRDALANLRAHHELVPALWRRAADHDHDEPPAQALEDLAAALAQPWPEDQGRLWLRAALAYPTVAESTHPALAERLAALGVELPERPPPPADPSAAEVLLGDARASLWAAVGALWASKHAKEWARAREVEGHARERIRELESVVGRAQIPPEEEVELALLAASRRPAEQALPWLRRAADLAPERADVGAALGLALLESDDDASRDEGARLLGRWLPAVPERMEEGLWRLLLDRLRRGLDEEVPGLAARLARWPHEWAQFLRERSSLSPRDRLAPHDLSAGDKGLLVATLRARPEVRRAWVVLKVVEALPEVPCRFLVVETMSDGQRLRPVAEQRALADALRESPHLPPHTEVVVAESGLREGMLPVVGVAERVRGALVYERPDRE